VVRKNVDRAVGQFWTLLTLIIAVNGGCVEQVTPIYRKYHG